MAKFFGTNGIRGIFGEDFSLEFIHDMTLAIGTYFKEGPILIGFDGRHSSPLISKVVCATLNSLGIDCNMTGLVPTPCLEFAVKSLGFKGGIMITASHNPPQYNGIKPVAADGVEISREDEIVIEDIYQEKKWTRVSRLGTTKEETRTIQSYIDGIKSQVDWEKIRTKNFKVALDLGNGAQAEVAPLLCSELGCQVFSVNETIDGNFPGRGSEPTPQNLDELSKLVVENSTDLGIAFDGDGDRSLFCDEKGEILTGDKSALLFSKYLLQKNPNSTIVTCLNSGSSIERLASEAGSKVIRTKVGSVEVSRKMTSVDALIGFEENGGFMYGPFNHVRDGCMTLALALDLLASTDKAISEHVATLPPSFTTKDKVSCSKEAANKLITILKDENPDSDTTDGIKIVFDSQTWVMIRSSGTEPIIRIYGEASSVEKLDELMSKYIQKTKSILAG